MEVVNSSLIKYLVWLNCFTMKHKEINDASPITSEYSEIDIISLSKIGNIYNLVDEYAKKNYIEPVKTEYETYYCIEYWGAYYIIGNRFHIENENYCKRVECLDDPIDMCDVLDYESLKQKEEKTLTRILKVSYEA